ncbi:hypothetical protein GUITHDRAFT_158756 [Guillardia theta CCMP2712]|uniref:Very-long-chain aldehyde decarbonylase CER1-like C-terminal domain-containing protein n=1 Tax=Guillardia theta (strain CCMP2712) TaxID=905079 RepID=L1IG76_GUITC|nr:hypothetical protein GUITHDRAFT_158756 [Guillardia theta CCMP2712]EKX35243.1 hypothetical protein GUITHDRAFT_158756 [Guillardia theta CCMP2712]|eukprot:XP_005822223.1 hypothetical protein GUITHDRAFT_158756 [Guillardia theta CCMP2712]
MSSQQGKKAKGATQPGILYEFPWEFMGSYKYLLFLPFLYVVCSGQDDADNWCYHMLVIAGLRYAQVSLAREQRLLSSSPPLLLHLFLQLFLLPLVLLLLPLLLHASSPLPRLRVLTSMLAPPHSLYAKYHSHHHASFVTEAISGSVHPFMEHLMYTANFAIPLVGTWLAGGASISMFYLYLLGFDLLNMIGHCNFEFFPSAPSAVFLAHGTPLVSVFHLPFMTRSFAAHPFRTNLIMYILWPLCLPLLLVIRLIGRVFIADKHKLLQHRIETWVTPAFAMEFFFRSQWPRINSYIEDAIMSADAAGVKVFGLGALNKNEALNGGGSLFVKKHPDLRLRLVHGNTLTAAAVLHKIPRGVEEAFVVGATSKLGRAISLYLARKGVKVTMMTQSRERFEGIRSDCPAAYRGNLKHSLSIEDGRNCSCWVVGRFLTPAEQKVAPRGTTFHQFVVPPLPELRKDCSYTSLPAFTLPDSATGFRSCEMTMERRNVHACHAGALVHLLEGWTHHEVGAIDPDRIDVTWEAAERHGFRLVPDKKIC